MGNSKSEGFRQALRKRRDRLLSPFRSPSPAHSIGTVSQHPVQTDPNAVNGLTSITRSTVLPTSTLPINQTRDSDSDQRTPSPTDSAPNLSADQSVLRNRSPGSSAASYSETWSPAYREAVESFEGLDISLLEGKNLEQLFQKLEDDGEDAEDKLTFSKGVQFLKKNKVPLENLKLTLEVVSPVASLDPVAGAVVGAIKGVTAMAIALAGADLELAEKIGKLLKQIQYIDHCDIQGQKSGRADVHKALVSVYQTMLEFYQEATKILTTKVKARTLRMVLKGSELPQIIDKFAENCEHLHKLVGSVIGDNTNYIKDTAIDQRVNTLLGGDNRHGGDSWYHQNALYAQLQDLRADEACEFLLQTELFRKWRDQSVSQKLLLLGDMGSGKSVTMSWVVRHLEQTNEPQIPHPKVCWYYCRYPETDSVGIGQILRNLLLSLLKQMKSLQSGFLESYDAAPSSFDAVQNVSALRGFLHDALEAANRPVFIVIDGLDECSLQIRNDLLEFLEHLSQKFPGLKMMFSSRPERDVKDQLGEMDSIQLESSLRRDEIIAQKSVDKQLPHLQPSVKALIVEKLSHLAEGSGIWTRMVVQLIQVRRIRTCEAVEKFFKDVDTILPKDLSSLYVELYFRYTLEDSTNEELASTALKALASARRPLSISELSWAVGLSTDPEATTVEDLGDPVDGETFMDLIRPFVLQVDSTDLKKHQVRLSHQSVNDFVLERWALFPHLRGLAPSEHDPRDLDPRFGRANEFMLNLCIRYLLLAEIDDRPLLESQQSAISELPGFVYGSSDSDYGEEDSSSQDDSGDDMNCFDPAEHGFGHFFVYASCYWLIHLKTVTKEYLPGLCHVEKLCQKDSLRLKNWVEQRSRPNCTLKVQSHLFLGSLDPLRIVLTSSSQDMLCHLLEKSDFDPNIFQENTAMNAFFRLGFEGISSSLDISKLVILFENDRVGLQLRNLEFFGYVMSFSPSPFRFSQLVADWNPVFDLVNKASTTMIQQGWGSELMCLAAERGCMPIIQRLIEKAHTDPNLHDELLRPSMTEPRHAIQRAILTNQLHIVEYLLNDDPDVHLGCRSSLGGNVLHTASKKCIPEMFRILVPHFHEGMYQLDNQGDTPLMAIIKSPAGSLERFDSAQILFHHHEANPVGDLWKETHNPLAVALQDEDLDMCCLLIHAGKINPVVALIADGKMQADSKQSNLVVKESLLHALSKLCGINPALSESDPEAFRRFAKDHVQRRMDEPRPVETRYFWDTS